jgi:hypothetical protein
VIVAVYRYKGDVNTVSVGAGVGSAEELAVGARVGATEADAYGSDAGVPQAANSSAASMAQTDRRCAWENVPLMAESLYAAFGLVTGGGYAREAYGMLVAADQRE